MGMCESTAVPVMVWSLPSDVAGFTRDVLVCMRHHWVSGGAEAKTLLCTAPGGFLFAGGKHQECHFLAPAVLDPSDSSIYTPVLSFLGSPKNVWARAVLLLLLTDTGIVEVV